MEVKEDGQSIYINFNYGDESERFHGLLCIIHGHRNQYVDVVSVQYYLPRTMLTDSTILLFSLYTGYK